MYVVNYVIMCMLLMCTKLIIILNPIQDLKNRKYLCHREELSILGPTFIIHDVLKSRNANNKIYVT